MRNTETVVVIDFGADYNQQILKMIRKLNVFSIMLPCNIPFKEIQKYNPKAILLSGGPMSVYSPIAPRVDQQIFNMGIPILGISYGMQLMAHQLGGRVERAPKREYGEVGIESLQTSVLFKGMEKIKEVWMDHEDIVKALPAGFKALAKTKSTDIAALVDEKRNFYGIQFQTKGDSTKIIGDILKNFLYEIVGCKGDWQLNNFANDKVEEIREAVGNNIAICGLSGGVDSYVAAQIVKKAIGDKLYCIFVDNGLLRAGEAEEVVQEYSKEFGDNLIVVNARQRFLAKLKGVTEPENKRKAIGHEFIAIFDEEANKLTEATFLVQGTLYSDIIESGLGDGPKIKSHHNVGGLPENMKLALIEPLKELFKDEVREIGLTMGIPDYIIYRQPFPGPGLAVRIIGEVNETNLEIVRQADLIVREEIKKAGLERSIWQSFAVLATTLKSVGMKGANRTYQFPIIIRAVQSDDAMNAKWVKLPAELLDIMADRIVMEVKSVNRVLYDITSKPPATIEWE